MSAPHIHGRVASFSVSNAVEHLGCDLDLIRHEDRLTWADVGRELGKSEDRASDYAKALSEMTFTSFLLGIRAWNGRFADGVLGMVGKQIAPAADAPATSSDRAKATAITKALLLLSIALEDDDKASPREVRKMRRELIEAKDAIDELLGKLLLRSVG